MEAVSVKWNSDNNTVEGVEIDGVEINDKIFQEELSEYRVEDRDDRVDSLIGWIAERNMNDPKNEKETMKTDLKFLMSCEDELMFSSISTNIYVLFSKSPTLFNKIANGILELHNEMN